MKRKALSVLLAGAMAVSMGTVAMAEEWTQDYSGTTITLMASQDWIEDSEQELGAKFEEATGIHVDYQILPADQYQDNLLNRLNNGECTDIFMTQSGFAVDTTYHVDENAVSLADEPWADAYSVFSAAQTSVDGVNYGLTYYDTTTDYYMIYNKKILADAGVTEVPTTFEAFEDACQKVLDAGVTPIYEPVADGWHQTMLWTAAAQILDIKNPGTIEKLNKNEATFAENEDMKTMLEQLADLAAKGYFGEYYMSDEFANAETNLATGEYAMCFLKSGAIKSIVANEANAGYTEEDFGIMLLPLLDNQNLNVHPTGPSKFIYSKSENIEAAKLYLQYITTKDSLQYVIDNASDVENFPIDMGQTPEYSATTTEFLAQFDDSTSGMVLQDVATYFNEQWMEISANIAAMFIGDMTAEEVLQAIDDGRAQLAAAAGDEAWQ
ncbi:MAG: ABC transporter substrate-binding protein [Eubacteriales bacterium]|nr:ABC transporter substrate-binding protein [Eubacteriales bacterium]